MITKGFAARCAAITLLAASLVGIGTLTQSASASISDPGAFVSLSPARILDTRSSGGPLAAGQPRAVAVAGQGNIPAGAGAAVLNVTVVNPTVAGYLTVYPGDSAEPNASSINFSPGHTVPNLVTVHLPANGAVVIVIHTATGSGTADVLADVAGYYLAGTGTVPGTFNGQVPARALDTRTAAAPLTAGTPRNLQLAGTAALPVPAALISAVVLNVTVTNPNTPGYLTAYPGGSSVPTASNLNYSPGQTVANAVTVKTGPGGDVNLVIGGASGLHADVIVDVSGYYVAGTPSHAGTFIPVTPSRILETRAGSGLSGVIHGGVMAGLSVDLQVRGRGGIAYAAGAVVMNATMIQPSRQGYTTAYPADTNPPTASNLNFNAGDVVPNLVNAKVGGAGDVKLLYVSDNVNPDYGDMIADVAGFFIADNGAAGQAGPVTNVGINPVTAGQINLGWANPGGSTGTLVCRVTGGAAVNTPADCTAVNGGVMLAPVPAGVGGTADGYLSASTAYRYVIWATNTAGVSAPASISATTPGNTNSGQNPGSNTPPNGLNSYCDYTVPTLSMSCIAAAISDFNAARNQDGLGPLPIPSNFGVLTTAQQVFVLTNIDRLDHGKPAMAGMSGTLNNQTALSPYGQDPAFPPGTTQGGSNWSSTLNPLWTEFLWMYDDGVNSPNADCSSPGAAGCWGHRLNVIGPYNAPTAMGTSVTQSAGTSVLYIGQSSWTDWTFGWMWEQQFFPKGSPENP